MIYKAKQVDTDKALAYINSCRTYQDQRENIEYEKVKKFHEGVRKGLTLRKKYLVAPIMKAQKERIEMVYCL